MANKIQTNTPSSFSLAATTENYLTSSQVITSYTKAMKEVDPNVVYRFGDESLGIDELFTNLGQTKGVESITFEHYEKDHIRELLNVVNTYTGGAGVFNTTMTVQQSPQQNTYPYGSPNFYNGNPATSTSTGVNVRVNDLVDVKGVRCRVISVAADSLTFDIRSVSADFIPASESEIIIVGNSWAEMTDQPNGRETRLIKYSNDIQIIKDSYKVSGSAMGQKAWVNVQGQNKWYFEGIADTRKYFSSMCDLSYLVGEKITATNAAFDSTNQMEGLIPAINSYGVVQAKAAGAGTGLGLDDFAAIADAFAKNRGSQENMVLSGVGFKRELSDLLRSSAGLVAGGVQYAGLGGEGRAVNLGFESFTYSDYTFHTKTLQAFNDPKTLGAASSIYKDYAIVIPTGTTTAFNYGQEKVVVPSMSLVHQEVEGEDMGYYEWITGAAGGARNSENDSMKVNMRARKSIELYGLGRFALIT